MYKLDDESLKNLSEIEDLDRECPGMTILPSYKEVLSPDKQMKFVMKKFFKDQNSDLPIEITYTRDLTERKGGMGLYQSEEARQILTINA